MSAPLLFLFRYSRLFWLGACFTHLMPIACCVSERVPIWVRLAVPALVLTSAIWHWRRIFERRDWCLVWSEAGDVVLRGPKELDQLVEILPSSVDFGWLIALRWREVESGDEGFAVCASGGVAPALWRSVRRRLRQLHEFRMD